MTPEEFDAAAHQLLLSEHDGGLRPTMPGGGAAAGRGRAPARFAPEPRWGDAADDDERAPLNPLPGAPVRFTTSERQSSDAVPLAPSRRRRGGGAGGGQMS